MNAFTFRRVPADGRPRSQNLGGPGQVMRRFSALLALAGWNAGFVAAAVEPQPDPSQIVAKMEQVMRGDASYSEMTMRIVRPRFEREISLRAWQLNRRYTMILVTSPARDRGTAFLLREHNVWTYDQRDQRVNTMILDRITRFGNRDLPSRITVTPEDKPNEHTLLLYEKIDFEVELDASFFTQRNMQRVP